MTHNSLTIKPLVFEQFKLMVDYFLSADESYLTALGINKQLLPDKQAWLDSISKELAKPLETRSSYHLGWFCDDQVIGHARLTDIHPGHCGNIHFHIWYPNYRHKGLGIELLTQSINHYYQIFNLNKLISEPVASNEPPNKLLRQFGFTFVEQLKKQPHPICFEVDVNRYEYDC